MSRTWNLGISDKIYFHGHYLHPTLSFIYDTFQTLVVTLHSYIAINMIKSVKIIDNFNSISYVTNTQHSTMYTIICMDKCLNFSVQAVKS